MTQQHGSAPGRAMLLPNGNMLIPVRAEDDSGLVGDGMLEITPEDDRYDEWLPYAAPSVDDVPADADRPPGTSGSWGEA